MALNGSILKILSKTSRNRITGISAILLSNFHMSQTKNNNNKNTTATSDESVVSNMYQPGRKTAVQTENSVWKKQLTDEEFYVCRKKGTETPFSGAHCSTVLPGVYNCICCGANLFSSDDKFESGCGWPSFTRPISLTDDNGKVTTNLKENKDTSRGMQRIEVVCKLCDSHLGHVFPDGPPPTGLRYCINSVALKFEKKSE